jgi:hypothetical protein
MRSIGVGGRFAYAPDAIASRIDELMPGKIKPSQL